MMKLSTEIDFPKSNLNIDYQSNLLLMGSCFVNNIGSKLQNATFLTFINPFGVLYNPLSIAFALETLMSNKEFVEDDLFLQASLWSSFSHSSLFSATSQEETLQNINSRLIAARDFLKSTDLLVITMGTAWIYELKQTKEVVANCHKVPADQFDRRRLGVDEIVEKLSSVFKRLWVTHPALKILLTVSPIRHWKDGAHENTLSKATLHLAIDKLRKEFAAIDYFPAYELMIDELRDYRFYASDMLHPSEIAVDYIWNKFQQTYFTTETKSLVNRIEKFKTMLNHRPLHQDTKEYEAFQASVERNRQQLIDEFPFLKWRLD